MALTEFQRKNPNRPVSSRDYRTYLERSFHELRGDEMTQWWESGAVHTVLSSNKHAASFMSHLAKGLAHQEDQEKALLWWDRAMEAGAHLLTAAQKEQWLSVLALHPTLAHRLLDDGVSPHAAVVGGIGWEQKMTTATLMALAGLKTLMDPYKYKKPVSPVTIEAHWSLLERMWFTPGWGYEEQLQALDHLVWQGAHGPSTVRHKYALLRDQLVASVANPIPERPRQGADPIGRWVEQTFSSGEDYSHREWGLALLAHPPPTPVSRTPSFWFWKSLFKHDHGIEFVPLLAQFGVSPWDVEKARTSLSSSNVDIPPKTLLSWWWGKERCFKGDPPNALWKALEKAALTVGPPPPAWQACAIHDWLADWLKPPTAVTASQSTTSKSAPSISSWMKRWETWARLGRWKEQGCPNEVVDQIRLFSSNFVRFPDDMLQPTVAFWSRLGMTPKILMPPELRQSALTSTPVEEWRSRIRDWSLWRRLCISPRFHQEIMALLPVELERMHDAVVFAGAPLGGGSHAAEEQSAAHALRDNLFESFPQWIAEKGEKALEFALRNGDPLLLDHLLKRGLSVVPDRVWSAWSRSVKISATSSSSVNAPFSKDCPWMAMARSLHAYGIPLDAGPPETRPLCTAASHWDARVGDAAVRWFLEAGADPEAVDPTPSQTPAYLAWRVAREVQRLDRLPKSNVAPRRRRM